MIPSLSQPHPTLLRTLAIVLTTAHTAAALPFGIHVVDEATGRGVPLVTLTTVNGIEFITDSGGWVAFDEPGLMERPIFLTVSAPGYAIAEDGFGFPGVRLTPTPDDETEIKLMRLHPAQRLYRITGQGLYRDTLLLGKEPPLPRPLLNAAVLGQDSVQVVPYHGRLFWLWGDTLLPPHPLGNFHSTGAWSDLPTHGGMSPEHGIHLDYLTIEPEHIRPLMPSPQPGMLWLSGLTSVGPPDRERLIAHYARHLSLTERAEHGLAEFLPEHQQFVPVTELGDEFEWQHPTGQSVIVSEASGHWVYFANPFCTVRAPATADALLLPSNYEALTWDRQAAEWTWQTADKPTTQQQENQWLKSGILPADKARFQVCSAHDKRPLKAHRGSIRWNDYRQRWLLLFVESGAPESVLGEVWYAESDAPVGPWNSAVKVASHPRYSFYNPTHHAFFDEDGGRTIYFEGTYSNTFSGNHHPTPRYDYNQLLYRLELDDPRLQPAQH